MTGWYFYWLLLLATLPSWGAVLVSNSIPQARIILPSRPGPILREAALSMQEGIARVSGAKVPIIDEARYRQEAGNAIILVGESEVAKKLGFSLPPLKLGGIFLECRSNILFIAGNDDVSGNQRATLNAAVHFQEKYLGIRQLWPGINGLVAPNQSSLQIKDFKYRFESPLAQRKIRIQQLHPRAKLGLEMLDISTADYLKAKGITGNRSPTEEWRTWQRLGGSADFEGGHAFSDYWARFGKSHPEWFAMQPDGSRDQSRSPTRARLCKSNVQLIDFIARELVEEFNKNPMLQSASLAPNDGGPLTFCLCPKCEALDSKKGREIVLYNRTVRPIREIKHVSLTDRMVWFWNAIAERVSKVHPGKLLVIDAYSVYRTPPLERKLHPNLVLRYVPLLYHDEELRAQSLRDFEGWTEKSSRILFRPNSLGWGRRTGLPMLFNKRFAADFKRMVPKGVMGVDADSCGEHWATQGLNYYIFAKLLWDPAQSVDELIRDYCVAGFGEAAGPMQSYFERLEAITDSAAQLKRQDYEVFSDGDLETLGKLITEAKSRAAKDAASLARVKFIECGLEWTKVEVRAHRAAQKDKKGSSETVSALKARSDMMAKIFREFPFALNVAFIAWGEDRQLSRFEGEPEN